MKLFVVFLCISTIALGQHQKDISPFDGRYWDIVLEHSDMKKIEVKENVLFGTISRPLHLDVYFPLAFGVPEERVTIVILNGIGDQEGTSLKNSPGYISWGRLLAAHGFVTVTMEAEVNKVQESFGLLFKYLKDHRNELHIDTARIGVQAFSANGRESIKYLMGGNAFSGIRGAVLFYGESPNAPFRADLPVYFIVAEKDIRDGNYANLWQNVLRTNAPWTITIANDMPHAFDFFSDSETSRRVIMSAISFFKDQIGNVPARTVPFSKEREIVAATYDRDQTRKLNLMREWMRENPHSKDAYAFGAYATALMDSQDFAEAEKYLKKAIALAPDNKGNYLMMAVVAYAQGKVSEGNENLVLYEKGSTPEGFTYFYIANRLIGIKKFRESVVLYERALTFPNPHAFIYYNLASCYAALGNVDKAFENLQKAVDKGFGTKQKYEADENLKAMRSDARWQALMTKLE